MPEVLDPFNRRESLKEITELQKKSINREEGGKPVSGRHTAEHVAKLPVAQLPSGGTEFMLPAPTEEHDPELSQRLDEYAAKAESDRAAILKEGLADIATPGKPDHSTPDAA